MIGAIIRWSIVNRLLVVLAALGLAVAGAFAIRATPVDALPDLSDVQVVVRTNYPGQAPQIVEDQVTYPMSAAMLSVPGARSVRGYSFFGDSFVYVIFDEGVDLYWARSRVLEYMSQARERLPEAARSSIGPDATGVGWVYQYALVDRTGGHDPGQLRSLQDWLLTFELKSVPGVAEVAAIGGMVRQHQIVLDPQKMAAYGVSQRMVADAVGRANQEAGGASIEIGEAEHVVRASGYLRSDDDFRAIPIKSTANGLAVTLGDVAWIETGPQMRRGIAELNGEGEVAGGVIVMRVGENPREVIAGVKAKLAELRDRLPKGVEIVTTYDRSGLIDRAVENLTVSDEWTKEGLAIEVDGRIRSPRVIEVLSRLVSTRGAPRFLRSDNGPEFVSRALLKWIVDQGIETALIDPGKPWQNGTTESFNGKFRDECLSLEWFRSRDEARVLIESWRRHFNEVRPHSSLGYMTPNEFVASIASNAAPVTATERTAAVRGASALRSVAQPLGHGQTQKAEAAAYSN